MRWSDDIRWIIVLNELEYSSIDLKLNSIGIVFMKAAKVQQKTDPMPKLQYEC